MIDQRLQDCVKAIELSDTRKKRIQTNVIEAAQKTNSLAVFLRRNRRAAVLALIFSGAPTPCACGIGQAHLSAHVSGFSSACTILSTHSKKHG